MELRRVELLSALGISPPLIHRFSPFNPQGGSRQLSQTAGFSGEVLSQEPTRGSSQGHPLRVVHDP